MGIVMKYIKTNDGRIIDVEKFIEEEKKNPYYTDYEFEEIKNEEDRCSIHWTAIGTRENSQKDQIGRRYQFGVIIDSPFIKQADTIEELCDEFIVVSYSTNEVMYQTKDYNYFDNLRKEDFRNHPTINNKYYGAIWFEGSNGEPILKSVAEMKDRGGLCLI